MARRHLSLTSSCRLLILLFGFALVGLAAVVVWRLTSDSWQPDIGRATGAQLDQTFRPPADANVVNVLSYGAVGDGKTDDTEAIQQAISDQVGTANTIFFPSGTYIISDTLEWRNGGGAWQPRLTLRGESARSTTLKLKDGLSKFGDRGRPRAVVVTASGLFSGGPNDGGKQYVVDGEGNEAFRNYIMNLSVDTGANNPGAVGIDFLANNNGAIVDVMVKSRDGQGRAGIVMNRKWVGPALIKNITIIGFDYGLRLEGPEYSITGENIRLADQGIAGIDNRGMPVSLRRLYSDNAVPAIRNSGQGLLVLLDSYLEGGRGRGDAIVGSGALHVRRTVSEGYESLVEGEAGNAKAAFTSASMSNFDGTDTDADIRQQIPEAPAVVEDESPWASVTDAKYAGGANPFDRTDDTDSIRSALNSGASTVYFPASGEHDRYLISETLAVPRTVTRIVGFNSTVAPAGNQFENPSRAKPILKLTSAGEGAPLVIESLRVGPYQDNRRGVIALTQASSRSVLARHVTFTGRYGVVALEGAGDVFLEDYCCGRLELRGARVYARQLNVETPSVKLNMTGSSAWILGLKTERGGSVVRAAKESRVDVLGGLLYPAGPVDPSTVAFEAEQSAQSLSYVVSSYTEDGNYALHAESGDAKVTRRHLPRRQKFGSLAPHYSMP